MRFAPLLVPLLLLSACGGDDGDGLVKIPPPQANNAGPAPNHNHGKRDKLPPPDKETVEKGAIKIGGFITRMSVYGFFPDLDTPEKRAEFGREKLTKLPPFSVKEFLSMDLNSPSPAMKVNLLEMDPANLLTLRQDYDAERFAKNLALTTRGAAEPSMIRQFMKGVTQENYLERVGKLHAAQFRNGKLYVFKLEGRPTGITYCPLAAFKAIEKERFNPYQ